MRRRSIKVILVDSCSIDARLEERRVFVDDGETLRVRDVFVRLPGSGDEWRRPVELLSRREVA